MIKRTLFLIIVFVICGKTAYASPVCAKQNTYIGYLRKNIDGSSYAVNNTIKAWRVNYDYDGDSANGAERIITGLAACNGVEESGGVGTANTGLFTDSTDIGVYCWCKMEPVYDNSSGGLGTTKLTGITSYWVYAYDYATANPSYSVADQENACAIQCTTKCAQLMKGGPNNGDDDFREIVFESIW